MRRVSFRVPASELDVVLDGLLPALPAGLRVIEREGEAELAIVAVSPLSHAEAEALAGRPLAAWHETAVPADTYERRLAAGVRVGRVVVRPPDAPAPPAGSVDVVVEPRTVVFGSGSHPTTRMCLELLLGLSPDGGLADLGCGLGTLAVAAAKLGWQPVVAVDRDAVAAAAAEETARRNEVSVGVSVVDLEAGDPPWQPTVLLNAAPDVQAHVVERMPPGVRTAIVSSFVEAEQDEVLARWAAAGFTERDRRTQDTWLAVTLKRDTPPLKGSDPLSGGDLDLGVERLIPFGSQGGQEPGRDPVRPRAELLDPAAAVEAAPALGQLATRLPDGGLVLSCARTVEIGARAAVLYLPSLFRFDLSPQHETLGVTLRSLVGVPHAWDADASSYDGFRRAAGEPIAFRGRFELPDGLLGVRIQVMTVSDEDQGAAHVIGKAAIRPIEDEEG